MRLAVLSALALLPGVAFATTPVQRIAPIPVILGDESGRFNISLIQSKISDAAEGRMGVNILTDEEMFVAHSDAAENVRNCGADTGCLAEQLRRVGADLGLVVVVNLVVEPPLLALRLLGAREGRVLTTASDTAHANPEAIEKGLGRLTREILDRAQYPLGGTVLVEVTPQASSIVLGNGEQPMRGTPNQFLVMPGEYEVSASHPGFVTTTSKVTAVEGQTVKVALELSEEPGLMSSPWFWVGVGVLAAGAVTTTAVLLSSSGDRCVCIAVPGAECPPC